MTKGKLILIAGPSGSGKGTLMNYIREEFPDFVFPVSWTTRAPREEELSPSWTGKRYHYATEDEFRARIAEGGFLEWAQYGSNLYGTPDEEIQRSLEEGRIVVHELEIQGVRQIRERIPQEQVTVICIDAGSWDELKRRILERADMSIDELEKRRLRFEEESVFKDTESDLVIENPYGKIEETKQHLAEAIRKITSA